MAFNYKTWGDSWTKLPFGDRWAGSWGGGLPSRSSGGAGGGGARNKVSARGDGHLIEARQAYYKETLRKKKRREEEALVRLLLRAL